MKQLVNLFIILLYTCFSANAITRPETDNYLEFVNNHANKTSEITGHTDSWAGNPLPSNFVLPSYHIPSYPEERYEVIGFYGNGVFRGCSQIKSIAIPSSYETIPPTTFVDCENLQLFSWTNGSPEGRRGDRLIENGILYSEYYVDSSYGIWKMFCYPAGKLNTEFQIPTKCNSIGEYCFYKQRHLRTILFHDKLKNIEDYSFYGCKELLSLTIPNGVYKIGVSAFEDCSSLETITIPASVTKIDKRTFANCTKLNTVTIENGVKVIDSEASRREEVEDLIKQDLFETLPDYKSYELVSIEMDTIEEAWISILGIIDLAKEYQQAFADEENAKIRYNELLDQKEKLKEKAFRTYMSSDLLGLARLDKKYKQLDKEIIAADSQWAEAADMAESLYGQLTNKIASNKSEDFVGWNVTHKFRANNDDGVSQLYCYHYYISPDMKRIIIKWNDEDEEILQLFNLMESVLDAIKNSELSSARQTGDTENDEFKDIAAIAV